MKRATIVGLLAISLVIGSTLPAFAWQSDLVVDGGPQVQPVSMVVAGSKPMIAWQAGGTLELARYSKPGGWSVETVRKEPNFAGCRTTDTETLAPVAAVTAAGNPVIASACDAVGGPSPVRFSTFAAGRWKTTKVGLGPSLDGVGALTANNVDLALDPADGRPSIVMASRGSGILTRFRFDGAEWRKKKLYQEPDAGSGHGSPLVSIDFDPVSGLLGVAWVRTGTASPLRYAEFSDTGRVGAIQSVPLGLDLGAYGIPSLDHTSDGRAVIAFQRGSVAERALSIAVETDPGWSVTDVDGEAALSGAAPSLLVGSTWWVASHDESDGDLRIASSVDGSVWANATIESTGDIGEYPCVATTATGGVRIAAYDRGALDVRWSKGP
jgi:hypothetical protein